jgi:hypothetical protein
MMVLASLFGSLLAQQVHAATGDAKPTAPTVADPWNSRLSVDVGSDGRYSVGAFPDSSTGDPTTGSFKLLFGWPSTGTTYSTLRIDGAEAILGQDAPVTAGPTDSGATNTTTFAEGAVTTTQTLSTAVWKFVRGGHAAWVGDSCSARRWRSRSRSVRV